MSGRAAVSSASKRPRCTCTTSALSPTSPNRDDHSQRGLSSWRNGDARPSWSADPATTSSTHGHQPPRPWNKSLESRDAGKPASPVRAGGRRKRTCSLQAPRRRPTGTCVDADFGPFFVKFSAYFPYTGKLCINGNEWAKRQAAKAGIGFEALDNGFAAVDDVAAVQTICDRLGPEQIDALLRKWLAILPSAFTNDDEAAGYRYELSIQQAEFSLTQMLDAPVSGRIFFEQVIRDNLDIGRPDQVALIFNRRILRRRRRPTPGRFRTRVITDGVVPSLHVDYKHTKIKQYHKQGRALRTETTINDPMTSTYPNG